ncbi:MAG: hypothetical protein MUE72_07915 [Chitinophagaceae bacterium]|nr:hypothetical protein [Chitinophagaceae bacterium]
MTKIIKSILIFSFQLVTFCLSATEQYGDRLVVNKDTSWIEATPLEDSLENKGSRSFGELNLGGNCSALWRGYVATWQLENNSLFLIKLQLDYCSDNPLDYDLSKEFNKNKVFADWVNRTIRKPEGRFIQHGNYSEPIHEGEIIYAFENGVLKRKNEYSFINNKNDCIFPGENYLIDTIRSLILNEISDAAKDMFSESETTEIAVNFKLTGELKFVELIDNDKEFSKDQIFLLSIAKRVLENFPKLMPVYHPRYEPQFAIVNINGYCLRNNKYKNGKCDKY